MSITVPALEGPSSPEALSTGWARTSARLLEVDYSPSSRQKHRLLSPSSSSATPTRSTSRSGSEMERKRRRPRLTCQKTVNSPQGQESPGMGRGRRTSADNEYGEESGAWTAHVKFPGCKCDAESNGYSRGRTGMYVFTRAENKERRTTSW